MSSTTISSAATSSAAMSPAATSSATMSSEWDKRFLAVPSPFGILRGGLPNKPINTEAEDGPVSARADAPNNVVPGDKTPILSLRSVASKSDLNVARSGTPATMRNDQCAPSTNSPAITSSYHLAASPPNIVVTSHTFHGHEVENAPPTPQLAPTKEPGLHDVDHAWGAYLDLNGFRSAFVPLRGTEWDRYRPIIEKGITEETERRASASEMLDKTEEVIVTIQNKLDMCHNRSPSQHQVSPSKKNGADQRTEKRLCSDLSTLINGRTKFIQFLEEYPRHERQYPDLHKGRCTTSYGILSVCTVLPVNYWYAGHRPGDHIIRIRDKPSDQTIGEGDMFYVHDLAGTGNNDGMEKCGVRFEGVVPFNNFELYQRFTGYVFTNFVRMVIAAVGFDPENRNYEVHNLTRKIWKIQTAEFEDITEREKTTALKDLQSLWRLKYGTDRTNYPDFLKAQVATSISHLREMGWLMSKLERDAPHHAGHHYWKPCKGLLKDFAGRDAALLAQEYYDITLANEAAELLEDGCLDDILVYRQSKSSRGIAKELTHPAVAQP
ncbi:hypothetical protein SAMD00023353_1800810 [Rosellinia necatrix]|uniref:Uncharacterized protein n=1 Tax=Rosellinia necatrix TaxID=77044 RepID=A0A1S8A7G8_ROSNE|nr:hypothetical protein SAMD00023353_1800810 [Rosellinia necatrix]